MAEGTPVVGDWVVVDPAPDGAVVHMVLTRRSRIARAAAGTKLKLQVIAANVDRVFLVMGLDGDFNIRRLERYLAICADAAVESVVLLTKAAACVDVAARSARCRRVAAAGGALAVEAIDVVDGIAADRPASYIEPAMTVALLGSSGAGKSTLANHLLGETRMVTGEVRAGDDRGRHITAHRELIGLPCGGLLIDNPGMRELALWLDADGLERAFSEIAEAARSCHFSDCAHDGEPGCAVHAAIDAGEVDPERLASLQRLQHEQAVTERRRTAHRRRDFERRQSKHYRSVQKERRRRRGE